MPLFRAGDLALRVGAGHDSRLSRIVSLGLGWYDRRVSVSIVPYAIAAVRTSVQRILEPRGNGLPMRAFRVASDFPAYWGEAVRLYGGEDFALSIASELPVGGFGRTSYAFASAATLGDAIRVFCRDAQRGVTGMTAQILVAGKRAELTLRGPALLWPIFEMLLAVLALRCRQLAEPPAEITAVGLPHAAPHDPAPWRQLFGVRPKFDLDHGYLALPAQHLERPLRTSDPLVRDALGTGSLQSTVDQVSAHLRAWVREAPDADQVARALGVSVRTLQRRLADEGVTFRQLLLAVRLDVAKQLLEREHMTISDVATAVGFARVTAFSRAFSAHTGLSPSSFRSQLRENRT